MVTSPHSLGTAAGLDVLRAGGSAIDAAIATSAVLSVVYPHMTGLGGDAFWLIHDGASGEVRYLNGGGKAAEGATLSALEARGLNEIPLRGIVPATLTVPGAVASWTEAHRVHGRLPLRRVLESAIGYARDGFPVTGRLASFIEMTRDDLVRDQARRGARHVAYRGPISRIYDRRARATRPHHQPLGRLERNGRSRARHHDRPAERHVERRFRPAQRWRGDRVLGRWINGPPSRAQPSERQGRRQAQSTSPFMHAVIKAVFPSDSVLPQPR